MISWITPNLAIGELSDIEPENIKDQKIDAILNLMVEEKYLIDKLPIERSAYAHTPVGLTDPDVSLPKFQVECNFASNWLFVLRERGYKRVLVHCVAGMDRSPFIIAIRLVRDGVCKSYSDAFERIKKARPIALEHSEWWHENWGLKHSVFVSGGRNMNAENCCANERPPRKVICQLKKGHEGSHRAVIFWEDE